MIKSDAQRDRTSVQIEGFRRALAKAEQEKPGKRAAAIRGSYEGMIGQLEDELHEYDEVKSGELTLPHVERLDQIAPFIAKIRIAKGVSQPNWRGGGPEQASHQPLRGERLSNRRGRAVPRDPGRYRCQNSGHPQRVRAPPAGGLAVRAIGQQKLRRHITVSLSFSMGRQCCFAARALGGQCGSHVSGPLWCRCFRNAGCAQLGWPGHFAGRSGTGTIMAAGVVFGIRNVPEDN